jgi:hypothetical protein
VNKAFRFVTLALFIALPVVCFAQDAAPVDGGGGIQLAPIILVLSILAAVLPFTAKLPGWGRVINGALPIVLGLLDQVTGLAAAHPKMAATALVLNLVGLSLSKVQADKRAAGI